MNNWIPYNFTCEKCGQQWSITLSRPQDDKDKVQLTPEQEEGIKAKEPKKPEREDTNPDKQKCPQCGTETKGVEKAQAEKEQDEKNQQKRQGKEKETAERVGHA